MSKEDVKDLSTKIMFTLVGMACGFFAYEVYKAYPHWRGRLLLFTVLAIVVVLLMLEKYRYKTKMNSMLHHIANDLMDISQSTADVKIKTDVSEIDEINRLYLAVDRLRLRFKKELDIKDKVLELENKLAVNIELDRLFDVLLPKLVEYTDSNWGVIYIYNSLTDKLELKKTVGLSKNVYKEFDVEIGEGLIGLAAKTKEIRLMSEIPENTVFENRTFLGKITPKSIMTVPVLEKEELVAVLAFASVYNYSENQVSIIRLLRRYLGFSILNCLDYERTQRLTKELQFQNELIQNMNEELEKKVGDRTDYLNSIINSIKDYMIVAVDTEGYITTWNEGAERLRGYSAEETIGKHITTLYEMEEEKDKVMRHFEIAAKEGKYSQFGWRHRKDGTRYYADIVITPIFNQQGELQGFTNITKDITITKNLERALISEKAYSEKMIASSSRALLYVDQEGIIINASEIAKNLLVVDGSEIIGKKIQDFFMDKDMVVKNIRNICKGYNRSEEVRELLHKHDDFKSVKISAAVVELEDENEKAGVIVYLTKS